MLRARDHPLGLVKGLSKLKIFFFSFKIGITVQSTKQINSKAPLFSITSISSSMNARAISKKNHPQKSWTWLRDMRIISNLT